MCWWSVRVRLPWGGGGEWGKGSGGDCIVGRERVCLGLWIGLGVSALRVCMCAASSVLLSLSLTCMYACVFSLLFLSLPPSPSSPPIPFLSPCLPLCLSLLPLCLSLLPLSPPCRNPLSLFIANRSFSKTTQGSIGIHRSIYLSTYLFIHIQMERGV